MSLPALFREGVDLAFGSCFQVPPLGHVPIVPVISKVQHLDTYGEEIKETNVLIGEPMSAPGARVLAEQDPYQFQ